MRSILLYLSLLAPWSFIKADNGCNHSGLLHQTVQPLYSYIEEGVESAEITVICDASNFLELQLVYTGSAPKLFCFVEVYGPGKRNLLKATEAVPLVVQSDRLKTLKFSAPPISSPFQTTRLRVTLSPSPSTRNSKASVLEFMLVKQWGGQHRQSSAIPVCYEVSPRQEQIISFAEEIVGAVEVEVLDLEQLFPGMDLPNVLGVDDQLYRSEGVNYWLPQRYVLDEEEGEFALESYYRPAEGSVVLRAKLRPTTAPDVNIILGKMLSARFGRPVEVAPMPGHPKIEHGWPSIQAELITSSEELSAATALKLEALTDRAGAASFSLGLGSTVGLATTVVFTPDLPGLPIVHIPADLTLRPPDVRYLSEGELSGTGRGTLLLHNDFCFPYTPGLIGVLVLGNRSSKHISWSLEGEAFTDQSAYPAFSSSEGRLFRELSLDTSMVLRYVMGTYEADSKCLQSTINALNTSLGQVERTIELPVLPDVLQHPGLVELAVEVKSKGLLPDGKSSSIRRFQYYPGKALQLGPFYTLTGQPPEYMLRILITDSMGATYTSPWQTQSRGEGVAISIPLLQRLISSFPW